MGTSLNFKQSIDILEECLKVKKSHQTIIGFAAESDLDEKILKEKWNRKKVDVLIGTKIEGINSKNKPIEGFANLSAQYLVLKDGENFESSVLPKRDLYRSMLGEYLNA